MTDASVGNMGALLPEINIFQTCLRQNTKLNISLLCLNCTLCLRYIDISNMYLFFFIYSEYATFVVFDIVWGYH